MKRNLLFLMIVMLFAAWHCDLQAQQRYGKQCGLNIEQRIKKQTQYVMNAMMLDDKGAAQFSQLYTQYLNELKKCIRTDEGFDFSKMSRGGKNKWTDEQIESMIKLRFVRSRKILDVREKYYEKFKKILTPRQIMKMYSAERNFGKEVQKEMEKRYRKKYGKR